MIVDKKWLQAVWWVLLYFFWIMVFQKREITFSRTATIEFCYLIFIAANFYLNMYYAVPHFLYKGKYSTFAIIFLSGIVLAALLRVPLASYLNRHYFLVGELQPGFASLFKNSFLNICVWVVCLVAGKLMIDRFRFQQYLDELARQKEKAELDFLNAQFNPHFLFNSINSIYGHIEKQNAVARNMLLTFSDMLRYQLYDCNNNLIDIEKETDYIKNYVALQKLRKEEGLIVDLNIDESVRGFSIAPLLFIAFIENGFKYAGTGEGAESKVMISLKRRGDTLHFSCFNTKNLHQVNSVEHKGIGIANARRRLALLYPHKNKLEIVENKNAYQVNLEIQLI